MGSAFWKANANVWTKNFNEDFVFNKEETAALFMLKFESTIIDKYIDKYD